MATLIPYAKDADDADALRYVYERAAAKLDLTPEQVAEVLAHVLIGATDMLEQGRNVVIHGFGAMGVEEEASGKLRPSFAPSRALRNAVEAVLSRERVAQSSAKLAAFDKRNRCAKGRTAQRPDTMLLEAVSQMKAHARKAERRADAPV